MIFEIKFTPEAEKTFDSVSERINLKWGTKVVIDLKIKWSNLSPQSLEIHFYIPLYLKGRS